MPPKKKSKKSVSKPKDIRTWCGDSDTTTELTKDARRSILKSRSPARSPSKEPLQERENHIEPSHSTDESTSVKKNYRTCMASRSLQARIPGSGPPINGHPEALTGLTFLITGQLDTLSRDAASDYIKSHSGQMRTGVTGRLSYLVVGTEPGEAKIATAKRLKTKCISEFELFKLVQKLSENKPQNGVESSTETPKNRSVQSQSSSRGSQPLKITEVHDSEVIECKDDPMWSEKYRPGKLSDLCYPVVANKLKHWVESSVIGSEGYSKKAALLSGPPGTGKTTTVHVIAKECDFDLIELNASDTRSSSTLHEQLSDVVVNQGIGKKKKLMILIDEVDGCDRGGVSELIKLIKKSKVPIVCTCNDRWHQKLRSFLNHVEDFRVTRAPSNVMANYISKILRKENVEIPYVALQDIISMSGNDYRSVLNNVQMWIRTQHVFDYQSAKKIARSSQKDDELSLFTTVESFFGSNMSKKLQEYRSLFYTQDLTPLFVQENYLHYDPSGITAAASYIAQGDVFQRKILSEQRWSLSNAHFLYSTMLPTFVTRGPYNSFAPPGVAQHYDRGRPVKFPSWLGQNSAQTKASNMILGIMSEGILPRSSSVVATEYLPVLRSAITAPLVHTDDDNRNAAIDKVLKTMQYYGLSREDWDSIVELSAIGSRCPAPDIPSVFKSAFTRSFNQAHPFQSASKALSYSPVDVDEEDETRGNANEKASSKKVSAKRSSSKPGAEKHSKSRRKKATE